jgi:hypothetical protein
VREVLYAGLHPVYKRDDDDTDADPADGGQALFHSDEFLEVLRRCERLGIEVVTMTHDSAIEHLDRYELRHLHRPFELFAKWKAEGCNELFGGYFRAPDALVDAYLAGKP